MADQQTPATGASPDPDSRSSGNQGARGSRGQANDGALPDNGSHDGHDKPAPQSTDLRDADAQGGGGAASDSSRSR